MAWSDLSDMEKLAYMQEAYSRLGEELKVDGDGIRGRLDRQYKEMYENPETRTKSRDMIVNGVKVGTYSLSVSEAKPAYSDKEFVVTDKEELRHNDDFDFRAWVSNWVDLNIDMLAEKYFEETGEVVDGCDYADVTYPATPMKIGSTSVRLNHKKFDEACGAELPPVISGFLTNGK